MDYRAFKVNVTLVEGIEGVLSFVNFFHKSKVYAAVSITGSSLANQETPLAKYFGEYPVWNCPMKFYLKESKLQENALTLRIQLRRKRMFGGDEHIAEALVPLKNLFDGNKNVMDENYCSSWLLSQSGGRRGFVYFSYYFSRTYPATAGSDGNSIVAPLSAWDR